MALQPTPEVLGGISTLLLKTLEYDNNVRQQAENKLAEFKGKPGFALCLLQIAQSDGVPVDIRQSACSYFRNLVTRLWDQAGMIPDGEKAQIKQVLPDLLLNAHPKLFKLISASTSVISNYDFPENWPSLMPTLVEKLNTQNFQQVITVLTVMNQVLKKYRNYGGEDGEAQLAQILKVIQAPVVSVLAGTAQQAIGQVGNEQALKVLLTAVKLLVGIIISLSTIDLPAYLEDNLANWLGALRAVLTMDIKFKSLLEDDDDEKAGLFHKVQTRIFVVLDLYMEKYEDEFKSYLEAFVKDAWGIIGKIPNKKRFDALYTASVNFLATVAKSTFYPIFQDPKILAELCQHIVVPNMKLRKDDINTFEDEPKAYVSRELDESDTESRRGCTLEFVKALRKNYESQVTGILARFVQELLEEYRKNPSSSSGFFAKDAAIYLMTALAVQTKTREGVLSTNSNVPIDQFYRAEILPELGTDHNSVQFLQASSLNFVINFRRNFNVNDFNSLIPLCVKFIGSKSEAIRSFAAQAVDKLLSIKDRQEANGKVVYVIRFGRAQLKPLLQGTIETLLATCEALRGPEMENHFVVRALDRVLSVAEVDAAPFIARSVNVMARLLTETYAKPANPLFGHHLWESIAALIKISFDSQADKASVLDSYEGALFPLFEKILTEPQADAYAPFVFQVMAQLIELRGSAKMPAGKVASLKERAGTMKGSYRSLLRKLTEPLYYESQGNIPALTRLLQAYIEHDPAFVAEGDNLMRTLGVFQKLVSSKVNDWLGFYILQSLTLALPVNALDQHFKTIITVIFTRLQSSKTMQLIKSFLIYISYFAVAHGPMAILQRIEGVQNGAFGMVIKSLWLTTATRIKGSVERKTCALAGIRFLTEAPAFLNQPLVVLWPDLFKSVVMLLENYVDEAATLEIANDTMDAVEDDAVTSSAFSSLRNASKPEYDLVPQLADPRPLLSSSIGELVQKNPAISQLVSQVPQEVMAVVQNVKYATK